jgi:hypothetical protein
MHSAYLFSTLNCFKKSLDYGSEGLEQTVTVPNQCQNSTEDRIHEGVEKGRERYLVPCCHNRRRWGAG